MVSCSKNSFTSFDVVKSYTVTDSLLDAKFINPFKSAQIIELTLFPKGNDKNQIFFLFPKGDGKYSLLGSSRDFANPTDIEVKFTTNPLVANVDFNEQSLFAAIITDIGKELIRPADHIYSFISFENNVFVLEGNMYGDRLEAKIIDPNTDLAQHIFGGGFAKDYEDQEKLYMKKEFMAFNIADTVAQLVVDPYASAVWIFYSAAKNFAELTLRQRGLKDHGYHPTISRAVSYRNSTLGDSLIFTNPVNMAGNNFIGLAWNADRTAYQAILGPVGKEALVPLRKDIKPFYTFTEMMTFVHAEHQDKEFYYGGKALQEEMVLYDILHRFKFKSSIKINFDSLRNIPSYSAGWTPIMKTNALKIADKISATSSNHKPLDLYLECHISSTLNAATARYHTGMLASFKVEFSVNNVIDSTITRSNILAASGNFPYAFYGFENAFCEKFYSKPSFGVPYGSSVLVDKELYDFVKTFEGSLVNLKYLDPVSPGGPVRVQMTGRKNNDIFIGNLQ